MYSKYNIKKKQSNPKENRKEKNSWSYQNRISNGIKFLRTRKNSYSFELLIKITRFLWWFVIAVIKYKNRR